MNANPDAILLRAWKEGAPGAYQELLHRHYASVRRFFEVKATQSAEDLTQKTFLECLEHSDRVERSRNFRAFLFGIG